MRPRFDWYLPRLGAALLLALLTAGAALAQGGSLPSWKVHRPAGVARSSLAFRLVQTQPGPGTLKLQGPGGEPLIVSAQAILTQDDITQVEVLEIPRWRKDVVTQYVVNLYFKPDAARRFKKFTGDHMGSILAVVVDGTVLMTPLIQTPIESPAMIQAGYGTRADATRVAERLAP